MIRIKYIVIKCIEIVDDMHLEEKEDGVFKLNLISVIGKKF